MLPDFLIIGAEKAGTTWLHDVMRGHPGLYLPDTKELHFFNRTDSNGRVTDRYARHGLAWYEARFDGARPGQMVGEATPLYLSDSAAPDRIRATLPEARFIIVLRDPVARSWSHYRMAVAKGHVVDPLDTLIDRRDETVLGRSLYAAQLDRWFSRFPRDRFLILFFEDVMSRKPPGARADRRVARRRSRAVPRRRAGEAAKSGCRVSQCGPLQRLGPGRPRAAGLSANPWPRLRDEVARSLRSGETGQPRAAAAAEDDRRAARRPHGGVSPRRRAPLRRPRPAPALATVPRAASAHGSAGTGPRPGGPRMIDGRIVIGDAATRHRFVGLRPRHGPDHGPVAARTGDPR
jgi:hypothetical protein